MINNDQSIYHTRRNAEVNFCKVRHKQQILTFCHIIGEKIYSWILTQKKWEPAIYHLVTMTLRTYLEEILKKSDASPKNDAQLITNPTKQKLEKEWWRKETK